MAKVVPKELSLDQEVADLVSRIGALGHPQSHISAYTVTRQTSNVTLVTVTLFADEHFCKVEEG